jgi:hypothetical protein
MKNNSKHTENLGKPSIDSVCNLLEAKINEILQHSIPFINEHITEIEKLNYNKSLSNDFLKAYYSLHPKLENNLLLSTISIFPLAKKVSKPNGITAPFAKTIYSSTLHLLTNYVKDLELLATEITTLSKLSKDVSLQGKLSATFKLSLARIHDLEQDLIQMVYYYKEYIIPGVSITNNRYYN